MPSNDPISQPDAHGSIRETLESIVIAFVLAFVFRAFVVEAFVIPTGSMAPTLLGEHVRFVCSACGYRVAVGSSQSNYALRAGDTAPCPMCAYGMPAPRAPSPGDRILVLKYIYKFSEPRRWDVVVFKNPTDPEQNYIKRLVGLPNEQLWIVEGNIFTRPIPGDAPPGPWRIQRKPARVQRAVWQPVYHGDNRPLDAADRRTPWLEPWAPAGESAAAWQHLTTAGQPALPGDPAALVWRYRSVDRPGLLRFDFNPLTSRNYYAYNYTPMGGGDGGGLIEDLRLALTVMPNAPGTRLTLRCQSQRRAMAATIEPDGKVTLIESTLGRDGKPGEWRVVGHATTAELEAGGRYRVELWHVDQALSLWVDGRQIAQWPYDDQDPDHLARPPLADAYPAAEIEVQGDVDLRSLDVDRDLYYTHAGRTKVTIEPDRFFCMGDNSPQSSDGRLWNDANPWVRHLTADEGEGREVAPGFVPRELMIGRAFFVYFPAPWRSPIGGYPIVPNFGDMRFIH